MHGPAKMHTALARDEKGKGQVGKGVVDVGGLGFGWARGGSVTRTVQ